MPSKISSWFKIVIYIFKFCVRIFFPTAFMHKVDLSKLTSDYVAQDEDRLVGTLVGKYKVSVACDARIALDGVNITGKDGENGWAGITCLGKCIFYLKGENRVVGGEGHDGVHSCLKLTITGPGSLFAQGRENRSGIGVSHLDELVVNCGMITANGGTRGVGIGGYSCGSIRINGGSITAKGGETCAGIGSGCYGKAKEIVICGGKVIATGGDDGAGIGCGVKGIAEKIEIRGGVVVATGGKNCAGIGGGNDSTIGSIKICETAKVTAIKGESACFSIGAHYLEACREVDIAGYSKKSIEMSPFVYGSPVKEQSEQEPARTHKVILDNLTQDYVAQNGDELTGSLIGKHKISIADGATVVLNGVIIRGYDIAPDDEVCPPGWPGIDCLGNCTIVLADGSSNEFVGGRHSAGIDAGPKGSTLTIKGEGSLIARGNGNGAGIGGGLSDVGDILLCGGSIEAVCDGYGAGIGSRLNGSVGNITITDGVKKLVAKTDPHFSVASCCIGSGRHGSCGNVTINGFEVGKLESKSFVYKGDVFTARFDANIDEVEGSMENQRVIPGAVKLVPNGFKHKHLFFAGWNTQKDGSGIAFDEQSLLTDIAENGAVVTLYAQWFDGDVSKLKRNFVAADGAVLTGTLDEYYELSIANGATVTLNNIHVTGKAAGEGFSSRGWNAITCLGHCTIVLQGENSVTGKNEYAGICVGPKDTTLTIKGDGSLVAHGGDNAAAIGGSGVEVVGEGGNIVICGGSITAVGGFNSAGIGGGCGYSIGNITICGGVVSATGHGDAAGIGGVYYYSVGKINIWGRETKVTATKGIEAPRSIGAGNNGECDGVLICGLSPRSRVIQRSPFVYEPSSVNISKGENGEFHAVKMKYGLTVDDVVFNREFLTQGYFPIAFPLNVNTEKLFNVMSIYSIEWISIDENRKKSVGLKEIWTHGSPHVELKANTPYMVTLFLLQKPIEGVASMLYKETLPEINGWKYHKTYANGEVYRKRKNAPVPRMLADEYLNLAVSPWLYPISFKVFYRPNSDEAMDEISFAIHFFYDKTSILANNIEVVMV